MTKTTETAGNLVGNKIADKITSLGSKPKNEEQEEHLEQQKKEGINYITRKKTANY